MYMKSILNTFRDRLSEGQISEDSDKTVYSHYRINLVIKITKKTNIDVTDVFNKIRAISGVTTLRQEQAISDRGTHYLCDLNIKFITKGIGTVDYVREVLVRFINSELDSQGIPGAKVHLINWNSFNQVGKR